MHDIYVKRIYDNYTEDNGWRALINRVWPRGVPKESAKIGLWLKHIVPSPTLRKLFSRDKSKCNEFKKLYFTKLNDKYDTLQFICDKLQSRNVTLLYSAKSMEFNNALTLKNTWRNSKDVKL